MSTRLGQVNIRFDIRTRIGVQFTPAHTVINYEDYCEDEYEEDEYEDDEFEDDEEDDLDDE